MIQLSAHLYRYLLMKSANEISEIDNDKVILSIPKEKIKNIILTHGCSVNRPFIQLVIAVVLLALGYFAGILPIKNYINQLINNPDIDRRPTFYTLFMALIWTPLGIYLVADVFKRRYYLLIETATGRQKIVFKDNLSKEKLFNFINNIRDKYRYSIRSDLNMS